MVLVGLLLLVGAALLSARYLSASEPSPRHFLSLGSRALSLAHDGIHVDIDRLNQQIASTTEPPASLYLSRARLLRFHGKIEEALADCTQVLVALDREGSNTSVNRWEELLERALCLMALERNSEARPLLDQVIQVAADRAPQALDARALLYLEAENTPEAIVSADRAFQISPTVDRALLRGDLLVSLGALEAASRKYREAIEVLGESRLIRDSWITVEITRGEYETALAMIDVELARAVVKTSWLLRRAEVYAAAGNDRLRSNALRSALAEADRVLARRRLPVHLVIRARVYLGLEDYSAARRDAEEARTLAPQYSQVDQLLKEIDTAIREKEQQSTQTSSSGDGP